VRPLREANRLKRR